ncbi:MAG: PAS domain S-box protein [Nevskia sp.]|nr:PAS domain S-box protein [Nevskia sp.]
MAIDDATPDSPQAGHPEAGDADPQWYQRLVESAPDAVILMDSEGRIVLVNAQTERLFGYPRSELLGKTVETLIPERYRRGHTVHRDTYFTEPKVRDMGAGVELAGRRRDGSEFPIEISLSPLKTARGMYATASVRDISSRRKSQQQFRALLESAPDAMVILDERGKIQLINAQTERMFGYQREALIGKTVEVLIPERLRGNHVGHRERYFQVPNVREMGAGLDLWGRRKDGSEFPIEISLSPMETETGTWATAAVRDVTERMKAEARFRALLETAPDAMVIIGTEGRIVLVNAQAERVFGYPRAELIGKTVEMLIPERLHGRHVGHRSQYFHSPKVRPMGMGLELRGRRKDGSEFPIEISLSPMESADGHFATAAVRDITDRKAVEERLAKYAESLHQSNQELEQFAYVASHDLQAPLRNVVSFTQLLQTELEIAPDSDAHTYMEHIVNSGAQMQVLIKDLLSFSRIGKQDEAMTTVDCEDLFRQVETQFLAVAREREAEITHEPLPTVCGSPHELKQLMQNLVGNALKFQRGQKPKVHVSALRQGEEWTISVQDQGIGIKPEHHARIFQIFQRLHTTREYDGSGVGLAICQKIVTRHGGRIWVESDGEHGSTFRFTLRSQGCS